MRRKKLIALMLSLATVAAVVIAVIVRTGIGSPIANLSQMPTVAAIQIGEVETTEPGIIDTVMLLLQGARQTNLTRLNVMNETPGWSQTQAFAARPSVPGQPDALALYLFDEEGTMMRRFYLYGGRYIYQGYVGIYRIHPADYDMIRMIHAELVLADAENMAIDIEQQAAEAIPDIWIRAIDYVDVMGLNVLAQSDRLQFAADENARLTLYIDTEQDEDGVFHFDTGHHSALILETSFGYFPLFPLERLQGGIAYEAFHQFNYETGAYDIFHVLVTVRQSAGLRIFSCVFDADEMAFRVMPVFNAENINPVGIWR